MVGKRPVDPTEHAQESAEEWADVAEFYVRHRMKMLGIPDDRAGTTDIEHGGTRRAFVPHEIDGGGNDPAGRINVDSGVLNPELNVGGPRASAIWKNARLRDRIDAVIAHENAEAEMGGDHAATIQQAPDTPLTIREKARDILRSIADDAKAQDR